VGVGFNLLNAGVGLAQLVGFPVVKVEVGFDGEGYHSYFGWVPTICRTDSARGSVIAEVDVPPCLDGDGRVGSVASPKHASGVAHMKPAPEATWPDCSRLTQMAERALSAASRSSYGRISMIRPS
jgi:hypothetical protein